MLHLCAYVFNLSIYLFIFYYFCIVNQIFHINNLAIIAQSIFTQYPTFNKFAFYGDLGAGKTTLIGAMCKHIGVTEITSSPTFAIIQEYEGKINNHIVPICHTDWYRLKNYSDLESAGLLDYLHNDNMYCFIEWPNNVSQAITDDILKIELSTIDEFHRCIVIK
jgi:tRNA threonylcarbamoyladenosine biosynthesis protein TsaE